LRAARRLRLRSAAVELVRDLLEIVGAVLGAALGRIGLTAIDELQHRELFRRERRCGCYCVVVLVSHAPAFICAIDRRAKNCARRN